MRLSVGEEKRDVVPWKVPNFASKDLIFETSSPDLYNGASLIMSLGTPLKLRALPCQGHEAHWTLVLDQ